MRLNRGTIIFVVVLALVIVAAAFLLREDSTTPDTTPEPTSVPQSLFGDLTADTITELTITRRIDDGDATVTAQTVLEPVSITFLLDADGNWMIEGAEAPIAATPVPEATTEMTAEAEATSEATVEATEVMEVTAESEATAEMTIEAEATSEATAEATAEIEATAEATPEVTPTVSAPLPLDQTAISQAISTLLGLRYRDSFTSDNLEQFGLTDAAYEITFVAGGANYRLRVGDKNVSGTQYYALLGEDETIYLLTSVANTDTVINLLLDTPYVIPPTPTPVPVLNAPGPLFVGYDAQVINTFILRDTSTGEELTLLKDATSGLWRIDGSDAQVEQQLVNIYLSQLGAMTALDKVPSANLDVLGLAEPQRFMIASVDDTTNYIVAVGNADPTGTRYYARVNDYADIAVIESGQIDFIFAMLEFPPIVPEITAEVTADAESTAEATESMEEMTPEATESMEATEEVTPEMTEEAED